MGCTNFCTLQYMCTFWRFLTGIWSEGAAADVSGQSVLGEVALRARQLVMMSSGANETRLGGGGGVV